MPESSVIVIAVAVCLVAIYALFILPTQWLKVEHVRHPLGLGIRVLQVSDLHVEKLRIRVDQLRHVLEHEQIDYIFLTGDFLDKIRYFPRLAPYLELFRESGVPVYAVLGNHDYKVRGINQFVGRIEAYGVKVLRNRCLNLENFDLIGIDDYYSGMSDIDKAYRSTIPGRPKIIITHDPNVVLILRKAFDYLMAGHLHGKQVNLPLIFKLHPMGPLAAGGIYKGVHKTEYGTYYISKGISQVGYNVRFGVRSEVTIHEF